jgi:hypothetical protein
MAYARNTNQPIRSAMNSKRTVLTITILAALITVAATWTMSKVEAGDFSGFSSMRKILKNPVY